METVGRLTVRLITEAWKPPAKGFRSKNYFSLFVWHDGQLDVRDAFEQDDTHEVVYPDISDIETVWRGFYNPRRNEVAVVVPDLYGKVRASETDDMLQALMNQYNVGPDRIVSQEPDRWTPPK